MPSYLEQINADIGFAQGDILRRFRDPLTRSGVSWGFILNADCDLANRKNQGHITWLEIVPTNNYWEDIWATGQLSKFAEKQSKQICEQMNAVIRKKGVSVEDLTYEKLVKWVTRQRPTDIAAAIGAKNSNLEKRIEAFLLATRQIDDENPLCTLETCQDLVGQDRNKNRVDFQKFITRQDGFPDFFLVPNLPEGDTKGYVVLLRRLNSAKESDVYKTFMDARVDDNPEAFHRIGRFADGVRYQIAQKTSFLFSRIGSPTEFESDCRQVVKWSIENRGESA